MPPSVSPSLRAASTSSTMRARRRGVEAPQRIGVERVDVVGRRAARRPRARATGPIDSVWLTRRMPSSARNAAGERAERDARGGLAGARALEDRARLVEVVLLHADEVGVTGTRARQRGAAAAGLLGQLDGLGAHHLDPLRPLGVADAQRDRAAEAQAVARRPPRSSVRPLRTSCASRGRSRACGGRGRLGSRRARSGTPAGQALHDGDEFGAVRFAGREHAEHSSSLPRAPARIAASTAPSSSQRRVGVARRRRSAPAAAPGAAASRARRSAGRPRAPTPSARAVGQWP